MKYLKTILELNEAKSAAAIKLFKMVVDGNTSEIEGVKISSAMAQAALDWFTSSAYARKYEKQVKTAAMGTVAPLIFGDNWGIKKRIPSKLKAEFKELEAQYKRVRPENESNTFESFLTDIKVNEKETTIVNESDKTTTMLLADEIEGAEYHTAFGDGTTVDARSTKKTWEDGVPVLKYIARASKKSVDMPKGKFEVVIDDKYGWIYWQAKGVWYGMDKEDDYIPFEF